VKLFGIKNCDTVKKALKHLEAHGHSVEFHDFRKDGLSKEQLTAWLDKISWQQLLNSRSTSYRQLSDEQKQDLDQTKALALMLENPTLIKRPVLEVDQQQLLVGFKPELYPN
jgi:arsenate reductase (glutaredoxin)